jgi:cold shock CspA family protein
VTLVTAAKQDAYQGVVCSMKDNYGFIERADIVREIFFHYSEFQGEITDVVPGDDVEFNVQTRNVSKMFMK